MFRADPLAHFCLGLPWRPKTGLLTLSARRYLPAMRFQMITDDGTRDVDFVFGKPADLARLSRWRAPLLSGPDARVRDAREFRKLAGKRWRGTRASVLMNC